MVNKSFIFSHFARLLCVLVAIFSFTFQFWASDSIHSSDLIKKADTEFHKGEFRAAADLFIDVWKSEGESASLFYDIANCYALSGDYGHAMLFYERAHRLDPSDKTISNNMRFIASKVEDSNRAELRGKKISVAPDTETFFDSLHRIVAEEHLSVVWAYWSVGCFILMLGSIAVYLFCSDVLVRKAGFFSAISLLILSVVFVICAYSAADHQSSHDKAVLITYKTELLNEPSTDAKASSSQICQGTVLSVLAEESDVNGDTRWYKVKLNSNFEGWLPAKDIEII